MYLVEDEPKRRGNREEDKYGSGDTSSKLNKEEDECLKEGKRNQSFMCIVEF